MLRRAYYEEAQAAIKLLRIGFQSAQVGIYGNPVSINSIIPGGGRHGAYLAKELREALNVGLGLIILRNFALGRAVPRWGAFAYVAGVTP